MLIDGPAINQGEVWKHNTLEMLGRFSQTRHLEAMSTDEIETAARGKKKR